MKTDMTIHKNITTVAAVFVTGLAIALAISSAASRAATPHTVVLLASLSIAGVLAVHLAPALLRTVPRLILWPVWLMALACALWAHAGFLATTAADAGAARLASSPATAAAAVRRADIEQAIENNKARPATVILRQLSWTTDPVRTAALQAELAEAQRRHQLQDQLLALSAAAAASAATAVFDPVSVTLASVLDVLPDAVQLATSLLLALLLEVFGMLLWREALSPSDRIKIIPEDVSQHAQHTELAAAPTAQAALQQIVKFTVQNSSPAASQHMQADAPHVAQMSLRQTAQVISDVQADAVSKLRAAVSAGHCVPTVSGIRTYLRCGQVRARELRRALDGV